MAEYSTRIDREKNRIYITISGYLSREGAEKLKEEYRAAVSGCSPGFTVLTDAREFKPGSSEVQEIVTAMSVLDGEAGCRKVARVVGNKPLGGMQIDRLAKTVATYPARNFETVAEAEVYLDSD